MYYYFCATLPALDMLEKPAWTIADFSEQCRRLLPPGGATAVARFFDDAPLTAHDPAWRRRQIEWERQLRYAVARWRAARLNVEMPPLATIPEFNLVLEEDVEEACAHASPLDREMALDRLRWRWADDEARRKPFSLEVVLSFALQLRLAWRWEGLQVEQGRKNVADMAVRIGGERWEDLESLAQRRRKPA